MIESMLEPHLKSIFLHFLKWSSDFTKKKNNLFLFIYFRFWSYAITSWNYFFDSWRCLCCYYAFCRLCKYFFFQILYRIINLIIVFLCLLYFLKVCDKIPYPIFVSIFGNTCMAIAFTFIGPLPFINIAPTVSSIQVCKKIYNNFFIYF